MTDELSPEQLELRKEGARCARMLLEASRRADRGGGNDIREMMMMICSRKGVASVIDLADNDPAAVIELWEAVELLEDGSFENVERRAKEGVE